MTWLLLVLAQDAEREIVDRREEARGAALATPGAIYRHYCAHCHGEDAKGEGRLWVSGMDPKPADLTAFAGREEDLFVAIRDGSAARGKSDLCPPWGRTVPTPDLRRLARHLAATPSKPPAPPAPSSPARQPFPWAWVCVIAAESALLIWMFSRKKGTPHAVPQDPPVRG